MPDHDDGRSDLALLQQTNRQMAQRVEPPGWYHMALGLLIGSLIALREAPPIWTFAALPAYGLGLLLLVRAKRSHMGIWINGYRAGRTRWVAFGALALMLAAYGLAAVAEIELHLWGAYLVAGAVIAAIVTATGRVWLWAYRRDLDPV